jgi:putative hydrolase of the HAD superfamily
VGSFRAVLFDAGDTLIRLSGSGGALLAQAAAALDADPDPAELALVWRRVLDRSGTAEELAKGRDLSADRHREVWTALYTAAGCERVVPGLSAELYARTVDAASWEAFPDAVPVLRAVRERGLRVGVVSDTGFDLRPALGRTGLSPYLDAVVLSYQLGVCKPAPEPFRAACARLAVPPERALMVGDNPLTDGGAVGAGLTTLLLPAPPPAGPRGLDRVLALL